MTAIRRIDPADLHLPPTAPLDITDLISLGAGMPSGEEPRPSARG